MASFDGVGHDDEQRREKDRVSSSPVPAVSSEFFLDHVGDVNLTLDSDGLSWKSLESMAIVSVRLITPPSSLLTFLHFLN
ncbi:hypothetical protein MLD38_033602 [Melastoma candidum]|uniref:Uncharacterized protein n=1 Tax=Melastoma candidum TaxID=119954 RepID=A0ACB9M9E8_9MYRT|nr:hypothetical protein MLD38_033602 [Melastoma candidum]